MLKVTERKRCPQDIKKDFYDHRTAPNTFIQWHKELAESELTALCSFSGAKIHNQWMENDGWFDGFKTTFVVIETQKERLFKIKWHEGMQGFFKLTASGAWTPLDAEDFDSESFVAMAECNK